MKPFNPRWIVGKTISAVDAKTMLWPVIDFTDGSSIGFSVREHENLDYEILINYYKAAK